MEVYRVCRTKWARDLNGEGARLFGGRWNRKGTSCIYTSSSRSLAILEFSVNISLDDIPRALSIVIIRIPDTQLLVNTEDLPGNWKDVPAPSSTREFGNTILTGKKHLVFRVPSAVIPQEYNYLINPIHPELAQCKVLQVEDLAYDIRIKLN
jgi:RES domain-containing protein